MRRVVFLFIRVLPTVILLSLLLPWRAVADDINFRSELTFSSSESTNKIKTTGETIKTEFDRFDQLYNLDISKTIYPYLTFDIGTNYEWNSSTSKTEGIKSEREERILRPVVGLRLDNPVYQAGMEYRRTEIQEDTTDLPDTEIIRDELDTRLAWNPLDLPRLNLSYLQTHIRDDPKTIDTINKLLNFQANYTAWQKLLLDYFYTRTETDNQIENFETLDQTHLGKIGYSDSFLDGRLSFITNYKIQYNTLEFPGAQTVESPLLRFDGLFSLDNTPEDGPALAVNNGLIDGNLTASTGIDIGLAGNQTTLTNIGVDLGSPVNVDEIRIWVDRRLTATVADSFSWSVYTSPDNTDLSTWTLVATVSPADFGTFDNRFEIPLPTVNTRFIKVVTAALSPTVIGATSFPNIFVTEMQAFITLSGQEVANKNTTIDHDYDLNLTAKLSDKTVLGYTLQYSFQDQDTPPRERSQLFNEAYLNHIFNNVFSGSARLSRTDETINDEDTVTYTYSASIRGAYLPTFDQTLTFSGRNTTEDEGSTYDYSIFLRSNATLYRGWSAFVDLGYTQSLFLGGTRNNSRFTRIGTNLIPNDKITFNINYSLKRTDQTNGENRQKTDSELDLELFFTPTRTLSITATINFVDREDLNTILQIYSVNWSPFPEGTLQFFFNYNETLSPGEDRRDRTIGPGLNWSIGPHFLLEVFYNLTKNETSTLETDTNTLFGQLRINF